MELTEADKFIIDLLTDRLVILEGDLIQSLKDGYSLADEKTSDKLSKLTGAGLITYKNLSFFDPAEPWYILGKSVGRIYCPARLSVM